MTENQVLADRVLIKPLVETQRASGIIVAENLRGQALEKKVMELVNQ